MIEAELQIATEIVLKGPGDPGHLDDGVLHGVQQDGTQQLMQPFVALLLGHQTPLDHPVSDADAFTIGQELLQRGHIQHAPPDQEVAELLSDRIAAQVLQIAVGPVEPPGSVILFEYELSLRPLLVERSHQGRQEMTDANFGHSRSGGGY